MKTLALLLLSLPLVALAQLVPLELDQTISLPSTSPVWDVMPDTSGNYLWVQAVQPGAAQTTRVFTGWGGSVHVDSLDLIVGTASSVTCFWRGESVESYMLLASQQNGQTLFRIYRLTDGQADSGSFHWQAGDFPGWPVSATYENFRVGMAIPLPPSPAVTTRLPVWIMYSYTWELSGGGQYSTGSATCAFPFSDMLIGSYEGHRPLFFEGMPDRAASSFAWAWADSDATAGYSGRQQSQAYGHPSFGAAVCEAEMRSDSTVDLGCLSRSCNETNIPECNIGPVATAFDTALHSAITFSYAPPAYGALFSNGSQDFAWTTPGPYAFWLAAEVVSTNSAEEFLCYSNTRRVFDVLGAADGHNYGVTDTITVGSEPRIIGRYDSTTRRLAFREGNQIKLYRFGEYLAAPSPLSPNPSALSLSAYPNPFNPSTQIAFSLPREQKVTLVVYDLAGRRVRTLLDEKVAAGEHAVSFDGAALPSGMYFARLSAGGIQRTGKLLLLK